MEIAMEEPLTDSNHFQSLFGETKLVCRFHHNSTFTHQLRMIKTFVQWLLEDMMKMQCL